MKKKQHTFTITWKGHSLLFYVLLLAAGIASNYYATHCTEISSCLMPAFHADDKIHGLNAGFDQHPSAQESRTSSSREEQEPVTNGV